MEFNANLFLAVISEIVILIYLFKKLSKNKFDNQSDVDIQENKENLEKEFLRSQQEQEAKTYTNLYQKDMAQNRNQNQAFSIQMLVLHVSIILGTLLYFAANTDKLPIQIDLGAAGEYAFVIVFAAVQTIAEILTFVKSRK